MSSLTRSLPVSRISNTIECSARSVGFHASLYAAHLGVIASRY